MKAKIIFISVLIILSISQKNFSQYSQQWVARYNDHNNSSDGGSFLVIDNSGNVSVAGTSDRRYLTVKYNSNGNQLWAAIYNLSYPIPADRPHGIAMDSYDNTYVTGEAKGQTYFYMDYATIKYNTNGNQSWVNIYNSPANDHDKATAIVIDKNDNIFVTGYSVSPCINGSFTWNTIKYSPGGNEIWVSRFCGYTGYVIAGSAPPSALAIDSSGNIIVAGHSDSAYLSNYGSIIIKYNQAGQEQWVKQFPINSSSCLVATDNSDNIYFTNYSYNYIKLIKLNSTGDTLWVRDYNNLYLKKLIVDKWKNVYLAGSAASPNSFIIVKYDSNGVQKWLMNDSLGKELNSVVSDDSGNVYATGYAGTTNASNYYTSKYNINGNKVWSAQYNGPADSGDVAFDIAVDNSNNIYVTGFSRGSRTNSDVATIKYSIITNSNNNSAVATGFNLYQNYPNPFNPETVIRYSLSENRLVTLKIFDVRGNEIATLVNEKQNPGSYNYQLSTVNYQLSSGIYYYKLEAGDFSEVRKMILLK